MCTLADRMNIGDEELKLLEHENRVCIKTVIMFSILDHGGSQWIAKSEGVQDIFEMTQSGNGITQLTTQTYATCNKGSH